jgi:hypothetical protein
VRQRAVICQDCWFWKEMSCALSNPEAGVCANKRPVQGRRAQQPKQPAQAALVPLAEGHAREPFSTDAPEATFTMSQLRTPEPVAAVPQEVESAAVRPIRTAPPSFREIRAGRAAAAGRAPVAEVRIPIGELEGGTLLTDAAQAQAAPSTMLPCMDSLVERVRQRTAARLNRAGAYSPA